MRIRIQDKKNSDPDKHPGSATLPAWLQKGHRYQPVEGKVDFSLQYLRFIL
jgi:hypothetical protein